MAARRLPSILPPLTLDEALAVTRVHSVAGVLGSEPIARTRPFRAPHHSISAAGLVGGGTPPAPGEASLAQHGVLFLDELAEFSRPSLEALRQPLEEGSVRITRAQRSVTFPARFMLVGASNPCPCGLHGRPAPRVHAARRPLLARYRAKLSGALLDRIDIVLRVEQPSRAELRAEGEPEPSARDPRAGDRRPRAPAQRLSGTPAACNAQMRPAELRRLCRLDGGARRALADAHDRAGLTMRGHDRAMRVARTLADLDGCDTVRASPRRPGGRLPGARPRRRRRWRARPHERLRAVPAPRRAAGPARALDRAHPRPAAADSRGAGPAGRAADRVGLRRPAGRGSIASWSRSTPHRARRDAERAGLADRLSAPRAVSVRAARCSAMRPRRSI